MGILRTILALAVVVYHSFKVFGLHWCGGQVAVESFYIISGFYMALILNEKYVGVGHYKKFILSRFLRIFPTYWFVLILALILSVIGHLYFSKSFYLFRYIDNYNCLSGTTMAYFIFENIIIIGQDILYFLRLDEWCQPIFTYNVLSYKHTGYQYLLVPQAWTISIEFMFYLLAPFIVTKKIKWQIALVLTGLFFKAFYHHYFNLCFDPWTYRFFPFELAFFVSGSLAYQFYKRIDNKTTPAYLGYLLLTICIIGVLFINELNINENLRNSLFYVLIFGSLPYIFKTFKHSKTDRYIGELSFSIYICHHLLVSIFRTIFYANFQYIAFYGYAVVISSVLLAILLQKVVISRVEDYRHKIFS